MRLLRLGAIAALSLLVAVLGAGNVGLAEGDGTAGFSRPLPLWATRESPYVSCLAGHFERAPFIQHWNVFFRGREAERVILLVLPVGGIPQEAGALQLRIQDEWGLQSITAPFPSSGRSESLALRLQGGKVYDLDIERLDPRPAPLAYQFRLGSPDPRLELGWAGPIRYIERDTAWAFHTDPGEQVRLTFLTDPPGPDTVEQATILTARIERPDGSVVLPSTRYERFPAELNIVDTPGETLVLHVQANNHYLMRKVSGSDTGLYAIACPDLASSPNAAGGAAPLGGAVPSRSPLQPDSSPGSNRDMGPLPLIGGVIGFLALAALAIAVWFQLVRLRRGVLQSALSTTQRAFPLDPATTQSSPQALPAAPAQVQAPLPEPQTAGAEPGPDLLTRREYDVAALLAGRMTNREIADALNISEGTAKRHVENILQKLGFESRAQVATWASRHDLKATGNRQTNRPRI